VREEIERYAGRMRYLKTRASVSTLTIAVHERAPVIVPVAGDGPILVAFRQAWENFVGLVATFIASLGVLVPLGVLVFVAWMGVRRYIPWRPSGGTPPAAGTITAGDPPKPWTDDRLQCQSEPKTDDSGRHLGILTSQSVLLYEMSHW
jgi:hypothetical protein